MKVAMSFRESIKLHAEKYLELGWLVLPLRGAAPPQIRWTEYRDGLKPPPTWKDWERWLEIDGLTGVAVILRSSRLAVFDFDSERIFKPLELHLKDYPIAKTRQGYHVFCSVCSELEGLPNLNLDERLELKLNALLPLPPSKHRKESSVKYQWLRAPWDLPSIPPPPPFLLDLVQKAQVAKEVKKALLGGFPRRFRFKSKSWRGPSEEEVLSFLNRLGVRAIPITIQGQPAYRLRPCPLCGQRSSNAWAWTDTWRLCCFGERRCPARLSEGGLPWHVWSKMAEEQR